MTTEQQAALDRIPFIQAFVDGKRVQWRPLKGCIAGDPGHWSDVTEFRTMVIDAEFRIAPDAPRKPMEVWINHYPVGIGEVASGSEEECRRRSYHGGVPVLFREVIKPDRKAREIWVNDYLDGLGKRLCNSAEEAELLSLVGVIRQVLFREVLE